MGYNTDGIEINTMQMGYNAMRTSIEPSAATSSDVTSPTACELITHEAFSD